MPTGHKKWSFGVERLRGIATVVVLVSATAFAGCCTSLGYFPEQVKSKNPAAPPKIGEVRKWASDVADGYDSRHTLNRYALYGGALVAAAGAGAMTGLAAFAPGSAALIGIPIGTTFLSGTMAIYNNEPKSLIYDRGSRAIKDLMTLSDCRCGKDCDAETSAKAADEAICLHRDVDGVMRQVSELISYLDPKNVTDTLKAVATSAEAKKVEADTAAKSLAKAKEAVKKAQGDLDAANAALKAKPKDDDVIAKQKAADDALKAAQAQETAAETADKDAKDAAASADSLLTKTLHATLEDSSSLEKVTSTCSIPPACVSAKNQVGGGD